MKNMTRTKVNERRTQRETRDDDDKFNYKILNGLNFFNVKDDAPSSSSSFLLFIFIFFFIVSSRFTSIK